MGMDYGKVRQWILREDSFDSDNLGKCESVMSLGNGYLGLRSAAEEAYTKETRDLLVAGTFNLFDDNEVTELPNVADMCAFRILLNGQELSLITGDTSDYSRELNIKIGELTRSFVWRSPQGERLRFVFYRIVSLERLHVIAQRLEITPLDHDTEILLYSGIDGRQTNAGTQHFSDGPKRFFDKQYMQYVQTTTQSKISFVTSCAVNLFDAVASAAGTENNLGVSPELYNERRKIYGGYTINVRAGKTLIAEKISTVHTTRDLDAAGKTLAEIQTQAIDELRELCALGYRSLAQESAKAWEEQVWSRTPIVISGNEMDQFAIRFAQYHMRIMVPAHDARMNIGAKGLSGEGYRGHTFWDTEIFLLPYYLFTAPEIARKLEEYRYFSLPGAHAKAEDAGYKGAMFPWESAWLDDGETCPLYQGIDVVSGTPVKVWTGIIEQHITADVAFGVWQYGIITDDTAYMEDYGYELIMDAAIFWASRLEAGEDGFYHINDVVGPDEFREHVNDNAFTNYMALWNIQKAMEYADYLKAKKPGIYARIDEKLDLEAAYAAWADAADNIYLPRPTTSGVLPQDDRYLSCRDIDLSKYKAQAHVGGLSRDYNMEQINQMQVSKQADVLVLFFLLEDRFAPEVKRASWEYYEPRTIHDSSLSLSTHSVLASDMGDTTMAYELFRRASTIDLGPFMKSSDAGIHAASFGGVWECVVYGFGGVRMLDGKLRINPSLPDAWDALSFTLIWKGQKLLVEVGKENVVHVKNLTGTKIVEVEVQGKPCML